MGYGTGLADKQLATEGYYVIDGLDLSPEMLDKACVLGVYRNLGECGLSGNIKLPRNYGAILCVGVFSHKLSQPFALAKLFCGLLPSGLLIATVNGRGWRDIGWADLLEQSAQLHHFTIKEIIDIPYLDKQEIGGKLLILSDGN